MSEPVGVGVGVRCEGVVHIYPSSAEGIDDVVLLAAVISRLQ